jgi:hypothetical protein
MSSKAEVKREQTITGLIEARKELLEAASTLSSQDQDEVFLGIWSVKDLLAHLIGWDYANLKAAQEILAGQSPTVMSQYDHDWQTYNAGLVAQYKRDDFSELLSCLEESHQELIGFLKTLPADAFDRDTGLRSRRRRVTIAWFLRFEIYDERRHCKQIEKFAEKKRGRRLKAG